MSMAFAGVLCSAYGAYRYVSTARALRAGKDAPMPDAGAIGIGAAIGLIGVVVMGALFSIR